MAERIEIKKEDLSAEYGRFRCNPNPPRPPKRLPGQHGGKLNNDWNTAIFDIKALRKASNIDTDNLMVLELGLSAMLYPQLRWTGFLVFAIYGLLRK
jgi:hypothetical protein